MSHPYTLVIHSLIISISTTPNKLGPKLGNQCFIPLGFIFFLVGTTAYHYTATVVALCTMSNAGGTKITKRLATMKGRLHVP